MKLFDKASMSGMRSAKHEWRSDLLIASVQSRLQNRHQSLTRRLAAFVKGGIRPYSDAVRCRVNGVLEQALQKAEFLFCAAKAVRRPLLHFSHPSSIHPHPTSLHPLPSSLHPHPSSLFPLPSSLFPLPSSLHNGFTLIELIVVISMILILAGAMTSSVVGAQRRAKLARAETEAQELTKAILAYANYTDDGTLSEVQDLNDAPATEDNLGFVFGKVSKRGAPVPVLYNGSVSADGRLLDPWGGQYRVTVKKGERVTPPGVPEMNVGVFYPNWHRNK